MTRRFPGDLRALIELTKGTRWESVAQDEAALEALLIQEMAKSPDPMTREIGSGLADGSMTWHSVAGGSAYASYVDDNLSAMRDFDFGQAVDTIAAEKERAERERAARDEHEDGESVWRGFGNNRR